MSGATLQGRHAVITGGGRGIGAAIAHARRAGGPDHADGPHARTDLELWNPMLAVNLTGTDLGMRGTPANIQAKTGRTAAEAEAELVKHNPQGRLVQPEEVANAVLWLCQPGSAAVTGQAIAVSGGETM